jgi:hypothetical protein
MKTYTQEEFKKKYGQQELNKFSIADFDKKQGTFSRAVLDAPSDLKEGFMGVKQDLGRRVETGIQASDARLRGEQGLLRTGFQQLGQAAGGAGDIISRGIMTVGKMFTTPEAEKATSESLADVAQKTGLVDALNRLEAYKQENPAKGRDIDAALGLFELALDRFGIKQAIRGTKALKDGVESGVDVVGTTARNAYDKLSDIRMPEMPPATQGVTQLLKEQAERIPRAFEKGKESTREALGRADRIRTSSPAVQNAIKSKVDDRLINTVLQADEPTIKAYKEMVDVVSTPSQTIKPSTQPSIVAGKAAEETFDILEGERKRIGKALEAEINALPTDVKVNMGVSKAQLEGVLAQNGVVVTDKGLGYSGKFTKAERARINELWETINEVPENATPKQVRDMDNLLSKLQRETKMEGLQDIMIDVNGEKKNLFQVFREQYTNQLENINPNIRQLNKEYRDARVLIDDLEDTIFKSGKYESIKGVDQAEFAKTNLRRIMGEAQSSPAYAEILSKMDARARELGYSGAKAEDLIYFAEELRKLYPESIPKTGFQGGIQTATGMPRMLDLVDGVMSAGKPGVVDQQRALKELLESLSKVD